jgi:hypothetical protein
MIESIRPGVVGSVGDVLSGERVKQSSPDFPVMIVGGGSIWGSNVQDGDVKGWSHKGVGGGTVVGETRKMSWNNNYVWQDIRKPDVLHQPSLASIPQYSWDNKLAQVYNAKRTGNMFLPVPGNYELPPGQVPRGNVVRVVAIDKPVDIDVQPVHSGARMFGGNSSQPLYRVVY